MADDRNVSSLLILADQKSHLKNKADIDVMGGLVEYRVCVVSFGSVKSY